MVGLLIRAEQLPAKSFWSRLWVRIPAITTFAYAARASQKKTLRPLGKLSKIPNSSLFRENQTCTKLWSPCRVAFAPLFSKGNLLFSGTGKRHVSMEILLILQNLLYESTVSPTGKLGAKGDAKWWTSIRCMV